MAIITLFDCFSRPVSSTPLITVLYQIKTGKYEKMVEDLRHCFEKDLDQAFDTQKRMIPRFSVAGNFNLVADKINMISYAGYLLMEIPYLNTWSLKKIKRLLINDPFVCACFINALGNGLVFIVKSSGNKEAHKLLFKEALKYYQILTGVNRFSIDGIEPDHICLISSDTDTYIDLGAIAFPKSIFKSLI